MGQINTTHDVGIVPAGKHKFPALVITSKKCYFITFNNTYVEQRMDKPNQTATPLLLMLFNCTQKAFNDWLMGFHLRPFEGLLTLGCHLLLNGTY